MIFYFTVPRLFTSIGLVIQYLEPEFIKQTEIVSFTFLNKSAAPVELATNMDMYIENDKIVEGKDIAIYKISYRGI